MFIADADIFQEKKMLKKRLLVKTARYDWSLYYIRKAIKRRWEVIEVKLRVSLKQTQPTVLVIQHVSTCVWGWKETKITKSKKRN